MSVTESDVRRAIAGARTMVVKVGSSSLTQPSGHLDVKKLNSLVAALSAASAQGARVVLVSSGAIAAGFGPLGFESRPSDVATQQAVAAVGREEEWDLVYQSRSGAPHIPWLEPDISDHLAVLAGKGLPGAAIVPVGFVSDHMEVVWDLDTVAIRDAHELGLVARRVATPGTDPRFVAMVADLLAEGRAAVDGLPVDRPSRGALGPRAVPCVAGCCPNPRGVRPALCGSDPA